ncbi:MAG: phosphoglucosamine mutase [Pseudomonadales bacterium]|nr:phosphoglucosamine mutase [Pseudomonadales bacterium]MBO6703047.1 phosphoglucosamine mutase [Pseudomonadales bacterium]MBO7006258.1 phosphoglucosamine mutase [Pseudomonadales bacterium]
MEKKYFGTDGIRGKVGEHPITAEFMLRLGWAAGRVFSKAGRGQILIGKDTRVSGYMFESALEAGLASAGVDVSLLGPMPTPAIAFLTRTMKASAGIVISASHNPYFDNGVKFFSGKGEKLGDEIELAIEAELDADMQMVASDQIGKVSRISDAAGRYVEFCKSCFPDELNLKGMKIALDCAHGATYHIAPKVLSELGADVMTLGVDPDGFNINREVGSTEPDALKNLVKSSGSDLGIALDGDGDRLIMVDGSGEVVDGDELLFVMCADRLSSGQLEGGVVGTLMSNFGLEEAFRKLDVPFTRASVGDRYVLAELLSRGWRLGGESSGHLICLDMTTTGDGIISALQVLAAIARSDESLNQLKQGMQKYPQHMINVSCGKKVDLSSQSGVADAVEATERQLAGKGRVLLRPSGTEPVVRVMVEGEDREVVTSLTEDLAQRVADALS